LEEGRKVKSLGDHLVKKEREGRRKGGLAFPYLITQNGGGKGGLGRSGFRTQNREVREGEVRARPSICGRKKNPRKGEKRKVMGRRVDESEGAVNSSPSAAFYPDKGKLRGEEKRIHPCFKRRKGKKES